MNKTITAVLLVFALAYSARAGDVFWGARFTTGTSFENQTNGWFSTKYDDQGELFGTNYWLDVDVAGGAVVTNYETGVAYDYPAMGTERNDLFDDEPRPGKGVPGTNGKFLYLDMDTPLERLAMPRTYDENPVSNVLVKAGQYDGIYADTLVKLSPSISPPAVDEADKIIVWMQEETSGRRSITNLIVTAGRYVGGFDRVEPVHYVIASPAVTAGVWCRVTIRAISNVTVGQGKLAPGFTVYFDGRPAVANEAYSVGEGYRTDWLTPEARLLVSERRLFPWIAAAGHNKAMALSRMAFSGQGGVDDVLFSTERPKHVVPDNVFTLEWDRGVKSLTCVVSNADSIVTNEIDAAQLPRFRDYALGTNNYARILVTNVVYDLVHDYSNGVWWAKNDCTVSGDTFVYDGKSDNPIGFVASSRDVVGVGEGGFETFAEARTRAQEKGVRTVLLLTNLVITAGKQAAGFNDGGVLLVEPGDDLILDLNGHTVQGKFASDPTIVQTGGRLRITDGVGGGAVLPPAGSPAGSRISVRSQCNNGENVPVLIMDAGRYDGEIRMAGKGGSPVSPEKFLGTCIVEGGSYTNFNEGLDFYLEQYVTNTSQYFGLSYSNYWITAAHGFIWSGAGADDCWTNAANWRCEAVPGAGDLAIFPRITDGSVGWSVDFGEGAVTKEFWMDADVVMSGTNEFSDVTVVSGAGRLVGTGVATFTGSLPGKLTADDERSGEIRLGDGWAGTVRISKITAAKILRDITGWGNARSRVEFAGVRGYLSDRANYAQSYELVLTDDGATPAWKNDTGYTGSTVSFAKLTGSGTFESPKNLREVLQVFQFRDVADFTGVFRLGGKRLLLGSGTVAQDAGAGHYTFTSGVGVRSGLGWEGVSAHFGTTLGVYGQFEDVLMNFTGVAPAVENVSVELTDATGAKTPGRLAILGTAVVVKPMDLLTIGGKTVAAGNVAGAVRAGTTFDVPDGSAVTIVGNDVYVNGKVVSTVANYYRVNPVGGSATTFAVQFDAEEAAPSLADFSVSSAGGVACVSVRNAKPGLWYGVQTASSLAARWRGPSEWKRAAGESLVLETPAPEDACFFRVLVTDDPEGGAQ